MQLTTTAFLRFPTITGQSSSKSINIRARYLNYFTAFSGLPKVWKALSIRTCISSVDILQRFRSAPLAHWAVLWVAYVQVHPW